jgi:hypothetical protein
MEYLYIELWASAFVALMIFNCGVMVGRRQRALKSESSTKRLCACNHNWSSHKDGGKGACNVRAHVPGVGVGNCSCLFYDGPTPEPDYTEFLRGSQQ